MLVRRERKAPLVISRHASFQLCVISRSSLYRRTPLTLSFFKFSFHLLRLHIISLLPVVLAERAASQGGYPAFASSVTGHLLVGRRRVVPALVTHTHILRVASTHTPTHTCQPQSGTKGTTGSLDTQTCKIGLNRSGQGAAFYPLC